MSQMESSNRAQSTTLLAGIAAVIMIVAGGIGVFLFVGQSGDAGTGGAQTATPMSTPTDTATSTPTATPASMPTPSPDKTPTATPTLTPTATPEPTPTATFTPVPTEDANARSYDPFVSRYTSRAEELVNIYGTPLDLRGSRIVDGELWLAVNLTAVQTDGSARADQLNTTVFAYMLTVADYNEDKVAGELPSGIRILEVDNSSSRAAATYHMNTTTGQSALDDEISDLRLLQLWGETGRFQTPPERRTALEINGTWPTREITPEDQQSAGRDTRHGQAHREGST